MPASAERARALPLSLLQEGERILRICNACRYCEGFCAVFPAVERRQRFGERELLHLANLCHDCGECYDACPYAPPHTFGVDVPRTLSAVRRETYRKYSWPAGFAGLFDRSRAVLVLGALVAPVLFLALLGVRSGEALLAAHGSAEGSFYRVMPYEVMASAFGILAALACVPLAVGPVRFWRDTGKDAVRPLDGRALLRGLKDAISLRYLSGGGGGCISAGDAPSQARRWFHHLTFYGFLLCLASTTVAAVYHNLLGREAPYAFASAPVVLGCAGGLGLLVGPAGLLWLKAKRRAGSADPGHAAMDVAFLVLLALTSLTGFLLLLMRESAAMGSLLGIHLGTVAGLFLSLPYSKFVHAGYRFCALVRNAMEEGGGR